LATLAAQEASAEYAATVTRLTLDVDRAKASSSLETKKLAEMRKNVHNRPIEKEFERILEGFGVVYQQYYTMTLVGEHVHRLLTNCEEICFQTKSMMLRHLPAGILNGQEKRDKVDVFMGHMVELMDTFDYLCSMMQKTEVQSDEAIDVFSMAAEYFGIIYRRYLNKRGTHKLHLLEVHVPEEMRRHRRLGLFDESQVEREHHTNKVYCLLFRNMKNWFKMHEAIHGRFYTSQVPEVQAATSVMMSTTARVRSLDSELRKEEKNDLKRKAIDDRREKVTDLVKSKGISRRLPLDS
jgi:hypothetical protein